MERLDQSLAQLRGLIKRGQNQDAIRFMEEGALKERFEELQKQQSAAEVKKDEYLKSIELLKTLIPKTESITDHTRLMSFGLLIETTDFLNMTPDRKEMIKNNMIWCNTQYEKYSNEH